MNYPRDIEQKIDFTTIRNWLSDLCTFAIGKERVQEIAFLTDFNQLLTELARTDEMIKIESDASLSFPNATMYDLRQSLSKMRIQGLFLDEDELARLRRALDAAAQYQHFFLSLDAVRFPALAVFVEPSSLPLSTIVAQIDKIVDKYGRMRDSASPELASIRRELQQAQGSAARALASILRQAQAEGLVEHDVQPTLREGRLVIPIPPAHKRKIGGIVHDESATGKTVYIEPQQVVDANNHIRELESQERRERTRILQQFADSIRPVLPDILASQQMLGDIDFLRAKALLAKQTNAVVPFVTNQPIIDFRQARHPILQARLQSQNKQIVPINLKLNQQNRILIISGPNAGGKSVCLKTAALLQFMLQCALPIPVAEDSNAGFFESIFIDIGDEQSIENDLSTYSSHLVNMKHFLRNADTNTLLLIDEFGGGTDPRMGGAIAEAVLSQLATQNAKGIITTHFDNLKHLAEDTDGLVNAAMLYDRQLLQPLFQLSIGQAGSSFALEIAYQAGLPQSILNHAKQLAGNEHIDYEKHLQDIARDKRYWEDKRLKVHNLEKQLQQKIELYDAQLSSVKQQQRDILNSAKQQAEDIIRQSNATIENTIRQIKESGAERESTKQARQQLQQFREQVAQTTADNHNGNRMADGNKSRNTAKSEPIKGQPAKSNAPTSTNLLQVGSRIRKRGTSLVGEVIEITEKQVLVAFGAIQSYIPLKQIEHVSGQKARVQTNTRPVSNVSNSIRSQSLNFKQQLDMRGMRIDEAYDQLLTYIDNAVMVGAEQVEILHGTGTGALRQLVRQYLQTDRRVKQFRDAHPDHGGAGITVVFFQ